MERIDIREPRSTMLTISHHVHWINRMRVSNETEILLDNRHQIIEEHR